MNTIAANLMNPQSILAGFGLAGVLTVVFAETGLLVGFVLPGDSLLFLAGVAASGAAARLANVHLPLAILLIGTPVAATAGAQLGHYLGACAGRRFFDRPGRRERLSRAEGYLQRFTVPKALILGRFVGVVRTFINPAAGLLKVPARRFFAWNLISAILWTDTIIIVGYLVGGAIPGGIDAYLLPVVLAIMFLSLLPLFGGILRARRRRSSLARPAHAPRGTPSAELATNEAFAAAVLLAALSEARTEEPLRDLAREISRRITARLRQPTNEDLI